MSELPPTIQVDLWNAFHPETFLPSSGKRMLWVLRRGVLDDLAPRVESVLSDAWQAEPTEDEQLVFRAVLEALATGRERPSEIVEFCNEIYAWPSVLGVAEYLTGNLAAAVRAATLDVTSDRQARQMRLPSWALVGTLLEALGAAPDPSDATLLPFTAALATVLGPKKGRLTGEHARLLVRLYFETDAGRRGSAQESALLARQEADHQSTSWEDGEGDKVRKLLRWLQALQLLQMNEALEEIRWTALTLRHLPPGQAANGWS
ncbi:hypothetical protein QTH90_05910 [Variovorax sp. J2P1-59]|uniref:hypothetical protein n=1 Tax=Variovorax flavidus TaxID=3053501 RepID=UPI00257528EB|nr:hypothetical protein [Variovorax sp. J2P1-59]MDM0073907.1 hypothetical protein [Variovorax sp. J2P1-59]